MRLALLLALQTTAEPPPMLSLLPKREGRCSDAMAGDIVVCGRADSERYRLRPLPPGDFADKPLRAETGLAGGTIGVVTEQVSLSGVASNRAMVRFKLKF